MSRKSASSSSASTTTTSEPEQTSYEIITPQTWTIKDHKIGVVKANKVGQGKSAKMTYRGRNFYVKTPKMYCPFDAQRPPKMEGKQPKENEQYTVQLAINDDDAECQMFHQKVMEFDEYMISEACKPENCVNWLGAPKSKPYSREVVENKYSPMLKFSKDKQTHEKSTMYPPFIRVGFPTTFKPPYEFTCEIYGKDNKTPLSVSTDPQADNCVSKIVPRGSMCSALLTGSFWSTAQSFGITWKIAQLKVFPPRDVLPRGKCIISDPEEEEDETNEEKFEKKVEKKVEKPGKVEESIEDKSEDPEEKGNLDEGELVEEDEAEVVEETPAPAPTPIPVLKKSITKK